MGKKTTLLENKPGKIKEKLNKKERKEDQKQDFFLGLFSSRAQRKKNAYIKKKNVQKNRKIVKNLLMYDKKNFLPHHTKNPQKNKIPPKQLSKKRKRMKKKIQNNQRRILK